MGSHIQTNTHAGNPANNKTSNQATLHTLEIQKATSYGILHSQTAPATGQASLRRLHSQLQQETHRTILRYGGPDAKGSSIYDVHYDKYGPTGSRTKVVPNP